MHVSILLALLIQDKINMRSSDTVIITTTINTVTTYFVHTATLILTLKSNSTPLKQSIEYYQSQTMKLMKALHRNGDSR